MNEENKKYTDVKVKELGNSEVEISAGITAEELDKAYKHTLKKLSETAKIDGFREGHVPENVILREYGEGYVLQQAANEVLSAIYPMIVMEQKLMAIGRPEVKITKLAMGNELEFTAKTAIMPEIKLPDYTKISKKEFAKKAELDVTEEEVQDVLKHVRKQKAQIDNYEKQKKDGVEKPEMQEVKDEDLPELTDEFVKTLGDFKDVAAFTDKVRENLMEEKKHKDMEKKRVATAEEIIKQAKIDLPTLLIDSELARIQAQFEGEITQAGLKLEDYLKKISKTMEELQQEWRPEAEKRAKLQLILNEIANKEEIKTDKKDVDHEVKHIMEHYKDADEQNVRVYVETMKTNEAVFKHLESLGK